MNHIASIRRGNHRVSVLLFIINVLYSRRRGAVAGNNPWGADSLEWAMTSPPPQLQLRHAADRARACMHCGKDLSERRVVSGLSTDKRIVLNTSILDARPEHRYELATDSILPFLLALVTGGFFTGLSSHPGRPGGGGVVDARPGLLVLARHRAAAGEA